jgi:hypothetical protein
MLRAEWAALQTLIREIHRSEEKHQAAERNILAAQLSTAKGLNWITVIGAIVGVLGLMGVAASIIIAKRAADDAHDALIAANRAWVGPSNVAIVSPVVKDSGISLQIFYQNSGREPGINAAVLHGNDVFTEPEWSDGTSSHYMVARVEHIEPLLALAAADDLADPRRQYVNCRDRPAIVVHPRVGW